MFDSTAKGSLTGGQSNQKWIVGIIKDGEKYKLY